MFAASRFGNTRTLASSVRRQKGKFSIRTSLTASVREVRMENFPFCRLTDDANVLVFPNLDAANIAYKLLWRLGGAEVIGPVLLGMHRPVNVLQMGASVFDIVNLAAFTALRAQGEFAF